MNQSPRLQHSRPRRGRAGDAALLLAGMLLLAIAIGWMTGLIPQRGDDAVSPQPAPPTAARAATELRDEAFAVQQQGRALRRVVQMLQWREVASVPLAPSDEVVVDRGDYQLLWAARPIDSSGFTGAFAHANPGPLPYTSQGFGEMPAPRVDSAAADVTWRHVSPAQIRLPENLAAVFRADGEWFVTAPEGAAPEVGDLRVRFDVLPAEVAAAAPALPGADDAAATAQALDWIARLAAFVLALIGAALSLRGGARLAQPQGVLGRMGSGATLAVAAWIAVAALLLAAGLSRLPG